MQNPEKKQSRAQMTTQQYLKREEHSSVRNEYVSGHMFAMTGSTKRHNRITMNIANALDAHVQSSPCQVYSNDIKVHVESSNCFYYPDVMIDCAEYGDNDVYTETPSLIVEVLSPSTWMIDKREKFIAYTTLDSLQEYLLVHQSKRMVELHKRTQHNQWEALVLTPTASDHVLLSSVPNGPFTLFFEVIYRGVRFNSTGIVQEESPDYYCNNGQYLDGEHQEW